jgi:hypothetical protein
MNEIIEEIILDNPEAIVLDGYDDAIIGIGSVYGSNMVLVYDIQKIISILMEDMSYDEALEFYDYNIACLYAGENTPILANVYKKKKKSKKLIDIL